MFFTLFIFLDPDNTQKYSKYTKASKKSKKVNDTSQTEPTVTCSNKPTAYEKLIAKLNTKRKAETAKDKQDEQRRKFPLPSDEENLETEDELGEGSKNNNAMVLRPLGATRSTADAVQLPDRSEWSSTSPTDRLTQTLEIIQKFMLKKGIIQKPMNVQELRNFLQEEENMEVD